MSAFLLLDPSGRELPVTLPEARPASMALIKSDDRMIEVCRSFSFKLNCGHYDPSKQYESQDFFCSQKVFCLPEQAEDASLAAYAFCKRQVLVAFNEAVADLRAQRDERIAPSKQPVKAATNGINGPRPRMGHENEAWG